MTRGSIRQGHRGAAVAQVAAVAVILAMLAAMPRPGGALLLVPTWSADGMAREAVAQGAALLAPGPGSTLLVRGRWGPLQRALLSHGVVVVGAPAIVCGGRI